MTQATVKACSEAISDMLFGDINNWSGRRIKIDDIQKNEDGTYTFLVSADFLPDPTEIDRLSVTVYKIPPLDPNKPHFERYHSLRSIKDGKYVDVIAGLDFAKMELI